MYNTLYAFYMTFKKVNMENGFLKKNNGIVVIEN